MPSTETKNALKVYSATSAGSFLTGLFWGAAYHSLRQACNAGTYILENALDYNCTATGYPCPHTGEVSHGIKNMELDCFNDTLQQEYLQGNATAYARAQPWSQAEIMNMTFAPVAFTIGVAAVVFAIRAKHPSNEQTVLPAEQKQASCFTRVFNFFKSYTVQDNLEATSLNVNSVESGSAPSYGAIYQRLS